MMADPDAPIVYTLTALYYVSVVLGLMIAVPVGTTTSSFNGVCLLSSVAEWERLGESQLAVSIHAGVVSRCYFIIYMTVIFPVIYAAVCAIIHTCEVCNGHGTLSNHGSDIQACVNFLLLMVYACVNGVIALMVLISACLYTVGFHEWCDSLTRGTPLDRCIFAQKDVNWEDTPVSSDTFYICLVLGLVASWILFVVWLFQTGIVCFFVMQQAFGRHFSTPSAPPHTIDNASPHTPDNADTSGV